MLKPKAESFMKIYLKTLKSVSAYRTFFFSLRVMKNFNAILIESSKYIVQIIQDLDKNMTKIEHFMI